MSRESSLCYTEDARHKLTTQNSKKTYLPESVHRKETSLASNTNEFSSKHTSCATNSRKCWPTLKAQLVEEAQEIQE